MLTLDVNIATFRPEGIKRVEKMLSVLQVQANIKYIVSWQEHENAAIPEFLENRPDVVISRLDEIGVSNNRNNAIKNSTGDLILIADDDLIYNAVSLNKVIEAFEENPEMDLGIFKMKYRKAKSYPAHGTFVTIPFPKGYYGSAVEIAFRRDKLGGLWFWPGIGPGNRFLQTGEDEFFLISAVRRGIKGIFMDLELGSHPELTTGNRKSEGILHGQGFIIASIYPWSWILRLPLKAYRVIRQNNGSYFASLYHLAKGSIYYLYKRGRIPECFRW